MPLSKKVEDVGDSLPKHGVPESVRHSREMGGNKRRLSQGQKLRGDTEGLEE